MIQRQVGQPRLRVPGPGSGVRMPVPAHHLDFPSDLVLHRGALQSHGERRHAIDNIVVRIRAGFDARGSVPKPFVHPFCPQIRRLHEMSIG